MDVKHDGPSCSAVTYRGADKSLVRPTSRRVFFDGENIYFDVILVIYIYIFIYIYIYLYIYIFIYIYVYIHTHIYSTNIPGPGVA